MYCDLTAGRLRGTQVSRAKTRYAMTFTEHSLLLILAYLHALGSMLRTYPEGFPTRESLWVKPHSHSVPAQRSFLQGNSFGFSQFCACMFLNLRAYKSDMSS